MWAAFRLLGIAGKRPGSCFFYSLASARIACASAAVLGHAELILRLDLTEILENIVVVISL